MVGVVQELLRRDIMNRLRCLFWQLMPHDHRYRFTGGEGLRCLRCARKRS